jgi:uncharacterized NAD(P)/FAD-binding protein YdhS
VKDVSNFEQQSESERMTCFTIAVIGAGFSGTLLALHLMQRCPPGTRVLLIERSSQFGRGTAYATSNPNHLLNVPAGRMSAFQRQPGHFLDWLKEQAAEEGGDEPTGASFVARQVFGRYIRTLLNQEIKRESGNILELQRGTVLDIRLDGRDVVLTLDRDRGLRADLTVLAVGNLPPEPPPAEDPSFYDSALYRSDPWAPDALEDLDPAASVLLIGTGLTMVDTAVSLLDLGHRGRIVALSRRGLLPRRHAGRHNPAAVEQPVAVPTGVLALTRLLRRMARQNLAAGGSWHGVIDRLRPYTADLWQSLSVEDRRRFLRHLRPWWDVHRHRMPGIVADRLDEAQSQGQLEIRTGRIRHLTERGPVAEVDYQPRGTTDLCRLEVARVINCAGPGADYARIRDPLVRSMMQQGLVRPDSLRLGLDVTSGGALKDGSGAISRQLFAIGPVTRGTFWEMTAVPDIRQQCEGLAGHLASQVPLN